ncbi:MULTISPECIES: glycosyltransferase [Streptomyces]|uniref:glycosyltransferase n=1 Tax=Streptomyces TaxID=1883 RepID=UPI00158FFF3B|nr:MULTISPECIES: glycosyltransferase [Streptomyces]QKV70691.1 glycosyltransferase family 1 protein [Streptomyces harbinensis]
MRVLCTAMASPSHGRALLPLARALAGAGHEVTVLTTEAVAPVFAADRITVLPLLPPAPPPPDGSPFDPAQDMSSPDHPLTALLAGPYARSILTILREAARRLRPDALVRDGMDFAAVVLAEERGIPHLPLPSGFLNLVEPAPLLPALNALRAEAGLPERTDPESLYPHGRFDFMPSAYSFARHRGPVLAYRQTTAVEPGGALPPWAGRLPGDRPLVLAALGTVLPTFGDAGRNVPLPPEATDPARTLRTLVAGLSRLEVTAVVATGGIPLTGVTPGPYLHLTDRIPQPLLLECADLFVTHGGYNSIREAVRTATPMAVVPNFGDQPHNARRVAALGLGRDLGPDPDADAVAAACHGLLADPALTARLRAARLAMLTLPEVGRAAADLTDLVSGGRLVTPRVPA